MTNFLETFTIITTIKEITMRFSIMLRSVMTGLCAVLAGCSCSKIEDYAGNKPVLDIRQYLNGDIEAWGIFLDRSGKADPSFHVTMKGTWVGNTGTLEEHFSYSDGSKDDRTWTIAFSDDTHFIGTAHDVIGEAKGRQVGNAVNMHYTLALKAKGSIYNMKMDDWMYLMDEHTLINHTYMSKFGFKVGELIITFRKK